MAAVLMLGGVSCMSGCGSQGTEEAADKAKEDRKAQICTMSVALSQEKASQITLPLAVSRKLVGKTLTIVGDSISTFDDWIPEGYYDFYPMNGEGVETVEQTWWKMVLNDMGMELGVNASSAGSTCIGDSLGTDTPQCGCNEFRLGNLTDANGVSPDIIIVYMGSNDFLKAIPLGDNDGTTKVKEGEIETFGDGYSLMLDKLISYYPDSDIFCCTLIPIGTWGVKRPFEIMVNGLELTSEDYSQKIEEIAWTKGCTVIDLQYCGITVDNMQEYTSDGLHMKPAGMILIRDAVKAAICGFYQDS